MTTAAVAPGRDGSGAPAPCAHADRLAAARSHLVRGQLPVPIQHLQKGPRFDDWQKLRPAEEDLAGLFSGDGNLGLLLGEPSSGLVDVDLDCVEALLLADVFLPATGMEHGRASTPRSHRWYVVDAAPESTEQFQEGKGKTRKVLVELRSTGGQTLVPPSIHPGGEVLCWDRDGEPARVQAGSLREAVAEIAAASLLARAWPAQGARHQAALALAGALLRAGWTESRVRRFLAAVARAAGDPEEADRVRVVQDTVENIARGRNVTGRGRLKEILGNQVVQSVWRWLRLREAPADGALPAGHAAPAEPLVSVVRSYAEVEPEETRWLWPGRIPFGMLSLVDGDPGLGKSTIAIDVAARVTRGHPMPDGTGGGEPGAVLLLSAEDDPSRTIRPRLDAAGADCARVYEMRLRLPEEDAEEGRLPVVPLDLTEVEKVIAERAIRLVVLDPFMALLSGEVNSHKDQDVRRAMAPLAALARRTGAAIVIIRHLNKSGGGSALYRGGGSIGIAGAARSVLLVGVDPDDEGRRVLAPVKCNLAPPADSLAYRVVAAGVGDGPSAGAARIDWLGTSNHKADALVAPPAREEQGPGKDAREFLLALLTPGPVPAKEVLRQARLACVATPTLRRAKSALAIRVVKTAMDGPWHWALPDGDPGGRPEDDHEGDHEGDHLPLTHWDDHLREIPPLSPRRNSLGDNVSSEGDHGDDHLRRNGQSMIIFEDDHLRESDHLRAIPAPSGCRNPLRNNGSGEDDHGAGEGGRPPKMIMEDDHLREEASARCRNPLEDKGSSEGDHGVVGESGPPLSLPPCPACASGHGIHYGCRPSGPSDPDAGRDGAAVRAAIADPDPTAAPAHLPSCDSPVSAPPSPTGSPPPGRR